ncbi:P60-like protein [Exidia glandulosa HHB12029]|uniref:Ribosome biogenesis protein NOP53 n=1 Tax=Exidia glandulosa HHB12029 TaxID=1314781 RepID=A0A165K906_EXIGL|nr:P60-like protein [Exidia glandulosa HHB12029]
MSGPKVSKPFNAPAQPSQPSRKGKKAWRKNVDIVEVEQRLEEMREEERVVGAPLQKRTDDELFQVDTAGDDKIRAKTKRFDMSQLKSAKILAQRSAVPAVVSRATVSSKDKQRLLQIGKRKRLDALAAHDAASGVIGAGSASLEPTAAVKQSGRYDVWTEPADDDSEATKVDEFIEPIVKKRKVKAPNTLLPHKNVDVTPINIPHEGTSYNPPVAAHTELLRKAVEVEEKRQADIARHASVTVPRTNVGDEGVDYTGMTLDVPTGQQDDEEPELEVVPVASRLPKRKTAQQRRKAAKIRAEKHVLAERAARKRLLGQVDGAKSLRKGTLASKAAHQAALEQRRAELLQKAKEGLAGQKVGKHKVPVGDIDVQLGEELGENLRTLKPEGNLFRDRFQSMQQRSLVEPRVRVMPKRRKLKLKDYELHSFKDFDSKKTYI